MISGPDLSSFILLLSTVVKSKTFMAPFIWSGHAILWFLVSSLLSVNKGAIGKGPYVCEPTLLQQMWIIVKITGLFLPVELYNNF